MNSGNLPRSTAGRLGRRRGTIPRAMAGQTDCCCPCESCADACDPGATLPAWYDLNATPEVTFPTIKQQAAASIDVRDPDPVLYYLRLTGAVASAARTYRVCKRQEDTVAYADGSHLHYALYNCLLPLNLFYTWETFQDSGGVAGPPVTLAPSTLFLQPTLWAYYYPDTDQTSLYYRVGVRYTGYKLYNPLFEADPETSNPAILSTWFVVSRNADPAAGPPNAAGTLGGACNEFGDYTLHGLGSIFATPCGDVS